jgi:hypothetical protein
MAKQNAKKVRAQQIARFPLDEANVKVLMCVKGLGEELFVHEKGRFFTTGQQK